MATRVRTAWLGVLAVLWGLGVARLGAAGPFDFDGSAASQIVLSWEPGPPARLFEPAMINRAAGVAAIVDGADLRRLVVRSRRAEEVGWPSETEVLGYAHVSRADATQSFRVGLTPDGLALFGAVGEGPVFAMPAEGCEALTSPLRRYAGGFAGGDGLPRGVVTPMPAPYRHAPVLLDEATIRERLNGGRRSNLPETTRILRDEQFYLRLPRGYTSRQPAGLVVWIPASDVGQPPEIFAEAADKLNLVLVGADDSGNVRLAPDRYQLALDQVETVTRLVHIDPARVYVTGISGGGRISSALVACFPDIFTGAVPIVGLNCYEHVPLGNGTFVPLGFRKPDAARWRLLRGHRIAPMTGPLDFNYREMVHATRIYRGDGLDVQLFDYEDMAHTLPTAERFTEAIAWVDAPIAAERQDAWADAAEQIEAYLSRFGGLPVTSDTQRRLLERVAETAPWSPSAWRACELLGVIMPAEDTDSVSP